MPSARRLASSIVLMLSIPLSQLAAPPAGAGGDNVFAGKQIHTIAIDFYEVMGVGTFDYAEFTATHVVGLVNAALTTYDLVKFQIKFNGKVGEKMYVDDVSLLLTPAAP